MEVACSLEQTTVWVGPRVVAAGFFDGVHRGHQRLLSQTVQRAQEVQGKSAVLTFDPHPLAIINPHEAPFMLSTMEQKLKSMESLGVDYVLKLPFDGYLRRLSPEEFVEEVIGKFLSPQLMIVGFNFTFGHKAVGRVEDLERLLKRADIGMEVMQPVVVDGTIISSTAIRQFLSQGDVEQAASFLGRPYRLQGHVETGYGRGSTLGFPTCNLRTPERVMVPKRGVYVVSAVLPGGDKVNAVCNIGYRPTFGDTTNTIEVHLIDHKGNHYGDVLAVDFHRYLREEQRFASVEMLKSQVSCDIQKTRDYFSDFACSQGV